MNAVNIIVGFSVFALCFSSAAMIILLSVFSGLQSLNIKFISDVNPEIRISPSKGKYLNTISELQSKLNKYDEIRAFSTDISEKVYLTYRERSDVAQMVGVDENYTQIYPLDTTLIAGNYFSQEYENEMLVSNPLAYRLNVPLSNTEFIRMYVPKPGTGRITNIEENFTILPAFTQGVFYINDNFNNTIFVPVEFSRKLLSLPANSVSHLNIALQNPDSRAEFKTLLQEELGNTYKVETREEQDASFLQMMNIEKLMIYLLMTLVTIITTFTLAGAVVVIILDKRKQSQSLISMGLSPSQLKYSYFLTGIIITTIGLFFGLILGSLVIFLQQKFELFMVNQYYPYPVEFQWGNYGIVIATVLIFGMLVSYLSSRKLYF